MDNFDSFGSGNFGQNGNNANAQGGGNAYGAQSGSPYGAQNGSPYGSSQNENPYGSQMNGMNGGGYTPNATYTPYSAGKKKKAKTKKPHPTAKKFGVAAAIAVVFGLVAALMFQGTTYVSEKILGKDTASTVTATSSNDSDGSVKTLTKSSGKVDATKTSTATTVNNVSDIVTNVMPSIVQVTNVTLKEYQDWFGGTYTQKVPSAGSGIIISEDSDYLYIATNNHVISGNSNGQTITIIFSDDTAVEGTIQGADESSDLAVVKVKLSDLSDSTLNTIKVATLGDSTKLKVGDSAVVIGNAMGYGQSVTTGVISALNREVSLEADDGTTISNKLIQTDAAVNPGNSGGALLNMNGEVIGIVSAKYVDTSAEGMGYAIPISNAESILTALMNGEQVSDNTDSLQNVTTANSNQTAVLGILGADVSTNLSTTYNMPQGVFVTMVYSGTGAEKAGLEKKDIITAVNGTSVSSMQELSDYLVNYKPGDTVTVTVAKYKDNYNTSQVDVTLSEKQ